jgi:hypothetical protein
MPDLRRMGAFNRVSEVERGDKAQAWWENCAVSSMPKGGHGILPFAPVAVRFADSRARIEAVGGCLCGSFRCRAFWWR